MELFDGRAYSRLEKGQGCCSEEKVGKCWARFIYIAWYILQVGAGLSLFAFAGGLFYQELIVGSEVAGHDAMNTDTGKAVAEALKAEQAPEDEKYEPNAGMIVFLTRMEDICASPTSETWLFKWIKGTEEYGEYYDANGELTVDVRDWILRRIRPSSESYMLGWETTVGSTMSGAWPLLAGAVVAAAMEPTDSRGNKIEKMSKAVFISLEGFKLVMKLGLLAGAMGHGSVAYVTVQRFYAEMWEFWNDLHFNADCNFFLATRALSYRDTFPLLMAATFSVFDTVLSLGIISWAFASSWKGCFFMNCCCLSMPLWKGVLALVSCAVVLASSPILLIVAYFLLMLVVVLWMLWSCITYFVCCGLCKDLYWLICMCGACKWLWAKVVCFAKWGFFGLLSSAWMLGAAVACFYFLVALAIPFFAFFGSIAGIAVLFLVIVFVLKTITQGAIGYQGPLDKYFEMVIKAAGEKFTGNYKLIDFEGWNITSPAFAFMLGAVTMIIVGITQKITDGWTLWYLYKQDSSNLPWWDVIGGFTMYNDMCSHCLFTWYTKDYNPLNYTMTEMFGISLPYVEQQVLFQDAYDPNGDGVPDVQWYLLWDMFDAVNGIIQTEVHIIVVDLPKFAANLVILSDLKAIFQNAFGLQDFLHGVFEMRFLLGVVMGFFKSGLSMLGGP